MAGFDAALDGVVVTIRLECISKTEGTDGMWWVAEGASDGRTQPRGIFAGKAAAEQLAGELAAKYGVPIEEKSWVA